MCVFNTIDKWRRIGLLDGMDDAKVPKLVNLYEDAAKILIADAVEGSFETVTFPITYRVVRDIDLDTVVTAEEIITAIKDNFERLVSELNQPPVAMDPEAEAAARVTEIIIENIKNKTK